MQSYDLAMGIFECEIPQLSIQERLRFFFLRQEYSNATTSFQVGKKSVLDILSSAFVIFLIFLIFPYISRDENMNASIRINIEDYSARIDLPFSVNLRLDENWHHLSFLICIIFLHYVMIPAKLNIFFILVKSNLNRSLK